MSAYFVIIGCLSFSVLLVIRNEWVYRQRCRWIKCDVYQFEKFAPSYDFMICHFWVWDAKKFLPPEASRLR